MALHQYIGARYVPKFFENSSGTAEWRGGVVYEPLTIVTWNNNSYTSKKTVPASVGDPSSNPSYWAATGLLNEEVSALSEQVSELSENVAAVEDRVKYVTPEQFGAVGDGITDDTAAFRTAIDHCRTHHTELHLNIAEYLITDALTIDFSLTIRGVNITNWHYGNPAREWASVISSRYGTTPSDFLITIQRGNRGCVNISNVYFDGNHYGSCIDLYRAGWTLNLQNVVIDNYAYHALKFDASYDSNIINLLVERCGGKYNSVPYYAMHFGTVPDETNTNAIHFTNLHMEFCRYYCNFVNCQDVVFENSKFEFLRYTADTFENVGRVDNDLTNPLFKFVTADYVAFNSSTFCLRGIHNWQEANPGAAPEDIPFAFVIEQNSSVYFNDSRIFSPDRDGGTPVIKVEAAAANTVFDNCIMKNITPLAPAMGGDNITIRNCYMFYYVHNDVASFTGVGSVVKNMTLQNTTLVFASYNKCTNNGASNGFKVLSGINFYAFGNSFVNFGNIEDIFVTETTKTLELTSGTEASVNFSAPGMSSGKYLLRISTTLPNGGNDGRSYIMVRTTAGTILYDGCMIPSNTTVKTYYVTVALKRSENITVSMFQNSGFAKTASITIAFSRE